MDVIDSTIANLAGPSIRADLGGSETTLQWVLTAYTAAFALGLITSGRRRLFLLGMAGFTLASLACGLAPGVGFLITARVLQGLFGSVMIPQGFALVKVVRRRFSRVPYRRTETARVPPPRGVRRETRERRYGGCSAAAGRPVRCRRRG